MLKAALDPHESAADGDVVEDVLLRKSDERRDVGGDVLRFVPVVDVVGVDEERLCHAADGEFFSVPVEDRAAQRLDTELIAALIAHPLCELIPLRDLQVGVSPRQDDEDRKHQYRHTSNAALHKPPKIFHTLFAAPIHSIPPLS
jgi:hypothetical protein